MTANPLALRTQLLALVEFNCHAIIAGRGQQRKSAAMNLATIVQSDMLGDLIPKYGRVYSRMSLAFIMQDICDAPNRSRPSSSLEGERKLQEAHDEENEASTGHDEEEDGRPPKALDSLSPAEWQRLIKRVERVRRQVLRMDANDWVDKSDNEEESPSTQYKNPPENDALNDELSQARAFGTEFDELILRYKVQKALSFIRSEVSNVDLEKQATEAEVAEGASVVTDAAAALSKISQYQDFVVSTFGAKPPIKARLLSVLHPSESDSPTQGTTPQALKLKPSNEVEKIINADDLSLRGFKRTVAKLLRKWEELALSEAELVAKGFGSTMLPPKDDTPANAAATASASSSFGVADSPSKNYASSGTRSKRTNGRKNRSGGSTHSDANEEEDGDEEAPQSQALITQPSSQYYRSENEPEQNSPDHRIKRVSRQESPQPLRDNTTSNENESCLDASTTKDADKVTANRAEGAGGEDRGKAQKKGTRRRRRKRHGTTSNGNDEHEIHQQIIPSLSVAVENLGARDPLPRIRALANAAAFVDSGNKASRTSGARVAEKRSARTLDFSSSDSDEIEGSPMPSSHGLKLQTPPPQPIHAATSARTRGDSASMESSKAKPRKKRRFFTNEEKEAIKKGVVRFGAGRWADMKSYYSIELANRTSVQIKDCYRTMMNKGEIRRD